MIHVRLHYEVRGGHTHVEVCSAFSGYVQFAEHLRNRTHGKNGELVFTNEEFEGLRGILERSSAFEFVAVERNQAA